MSDRPVDRRFPPTDAAGCVACNVRRIAHMDVPSGAQVVARDGLLFIGHMAPPHGTSIIDVRDPRRPSLLARIELPESHSHSHKVAVSGDLMVVNSQRHRRKFFRKAEKLLEAENALKKELGRAPVDAEIAVALKVKEADVPLLRAEWANGYEYGGFKVYDIGEPSRPREIAFQRTGGHGAHGLDFDGRFAYVSTEMKGYRGNILVNFDLSNPEKPHEVSRWCLPGQESPGDWMTGPVGGLWLHHALRCGDKIWAACWQAGVWVLDASDMSRPKVVGSYNYHPPFFEPTHTVMALPQTYKGRSLALAIDEEHDDHPRGQPHGMLWIFDVTDPEAMTPLSVFEVSELDSPWSRSGKFGAGQIVEHPTGDRVFATWCAGGLRVVDISDPSRPNEIGCFIPPPVAGFAAPDSMDVEVDERGVIFLLDRNGSLDVLEMER